MFELKDLTIDHILLGLIALFIIYIIYTTYMTQSLSKESFETFDGEVNIQQEQQIKVVHDKACSDAAISKSILDYQLSLLNQTKI
jgi:hypothetical protein